MGALTTEGEPQRESLVGKRGRVTVTEKGREVICEGPIIHERFIRWNDPSKPKPADWQDYWQVSIGLSAGATKTSGHSIEVAESGVQIIEA